MLLANSETALSNIDNSFYGAVKGNKSLLDLFFKGMFNAARTHLGFEGYTSDILITRAFSAGQLNCSKRQRDELEYAKSFSVIAKPKQRKIGKNKCALVAMSISKKLLTIICDEINKVNGSEKYHINDHGRLVSRKALTAALLKEHWDDMIAFAKSNEHYTSDWRSAGR